MTVDLFLSSIVDIAIGIAGFAGIIAAIQHRGLQHWTPQHRILLQILFFSSAMAIVFSLLPTVLRTIGTAETHIWKIGSTGLLAWYAFIVPYRVRQSRKYSAESPLPRALLFWVAISSAVQIYNLTTAGLAWPYLFGIFSLIVNGFSVFLLLLLGSEGSESS